MRAVFKLVLVVVAGISLGFVLLIALLGAALAFLWFVITGRKPALAARVTQFKQASGAWGQQAGRSPTQQTNPAEADVVDVYAREIGGAANEDPMESPSQKALR